MTNRLLVQKITGSITVILCGLGLGFAAAHSFKSSTPPPVHDAPPNPAPTELTRSLPGTHPEQPSPPPPRTVPAKRALLIGVTKYDNVPSAQLEGPANDVKLVQRFLQERYQFPPEGIVPLTENEGAPDWRPTRANIEREFRRLAGQAQTGDQVVILLAGHGSRQPEPDPPPDPANPEVDGFDEIFLPADVRPWTNPKDRVPNALIDNEIGAWLRAITAKNAYVWAIFDCCHSGTMTRGTEVVRELPPETLIPREELEKARQRAAGRPGKTRGGPDAKPPAFLPPEPSELLVATYACRSNESTPESLQPVGSRQAELHGLLSYTLIDVLTRSADTQAALTYRELVRRLQARYAGRIQGSPTPLVEGAGQDRIVLGTDKPTPAPFVLTRERGEYKVNAGDLYGLTPGSILAVETPAGPDGKRTLLGHLRVRETTPFAATVDSCAYEGATLAEFLPPLSPCRLVFLDYGLHRFKLAIQATPEQVASFKPLRRAIQPLADARVGLIELVEDPKKAEWLMRLDQGKFELLEASGNCNPFPLPSPDSPELEKSIRGTLERIYRARNLMALASRFEGDRGRGASAIDLEVEVISHKTKSSKDHGEVLPASPGGWVFRPGNFISFRVTNKSPSTKLDITLLVVGSDLEIQPFYPQPKRDEVGKPLEPGQSFDTPPPWGAISPDPPFGQERLVVLAAPATNPPVDFRVLSQRGLSEARGADASQSLQSPLGALLESAMFRTRGPGGMSRSVASRYGMRILTWRTEPK